MILKQSKSEQLFELLKDKAGTMCDGERFPSVRELMQEYGISQYSVAPALNRLESQNLIRRVVGKGTFVRKDGEQKPLSLFYYLSDWPDENGRQAEVLCRQYAEERQYDYHKVVFPYDQDIYDSLPLGQADAMIINPARADLSPKQLAVLEAAPIPVVLIRSSLTGQKINYVCGNNPVGGAMAANYFLEQGCDQLAILLSEPHGPTSQELLESFSHCAQSRQAQVRVVDCETQYGENSAIKAFETLNEWLTRHPLDFTGLFVTSASSALGALKALDEHNIRVPEDVSVVGFSDDPSAALFSPSLSVVAISSHEMVQAALDIIDQCLSEKKLHGFKQVVYPKIIERQSSKTPQTATINERDPS
jgi:DNA-binding LacI/PurR family transcriptional regulator